MKDAAKTSWFPACVKPVRVGVYETRFYVFGADGKLRQISGESHWDGREWSNQNHSYTRGGALQEKQWRGLADPPGSRRPGLGKILDELATRHPGLTLETLQARAKNEWHRRNVVAA